jgi:hypothetical protein
LEPSAEIREFEAHLAHAKKEHATWREAYADWVMKVPAFAAIAPPLPYYVWAVESGELDTDPGGADDPADQVYFAYREGLIKIGFSGAPRKLLSRACTITRTVFGGPLQEAMLHGVFAESSVWRDDRPERSSAEWFQPTPLLVKLAKAEEAIKKEAAHALFARFWRERYPNGCRIVIPSSSDWLPPSHGS